MTDDPTAALDAATEKTTMSEPADPASEQVLRPTDETVTDQDMTAETETTETETKEAEPATDGGDAAPPDDAMMGGDDGDDPPAPARRGISQLLGTLLIAVGILTILLTVGVTAWNRHQHDAETQAFLSRVTTPTTRATSASRAATTPFPSTVSGALVPDTARTPTANVATRAAQPVATTSDGKDRAVIAVVPAPTATLPLPATAADGSAPNATPVPPTPEPRPKMPKPTHLTIPVIGVDSNVVEVGISPVEIDGQQVNIWDVAPYAVGHNFSSANPGEGENVVLTGHDDWQGEVFKNLWRLKKGDQLTVQAGDRQIAYHVDEILLLPEVGQPLEKRIENAAFIGTTGDERLTLVTCWPYGVDDHRVIVIARPNQ
ncbi:MAG: sortase [Thermomicrobia bacterium]|nr:sortase [Thermomicrobia bacterium]